MHLARYERNYGGKVPVERGYIEVEEMNIWRKEWRTRKMKREAGNKNREERERTRGASQRNGNTKTRTEIRVDEDGREI